MSFYKERFVEHNVSRLFKQLSFWHSKSGDGFYKFLAPCEHPWYRKGDSWCEELKVSENTLRKYLKTLCASYGSKKSFGEKLDPFEGKHFASYFDRLRKVTFYFQNPHFQKKKLEKGRGVQKNLPARCGSDCASIYTDKTKINLYPPKSPLDQKSKKEVGGLNNLKIKKDGRGDLDQKSWETVQRMVSIWKEKTGGVIPTPKITEHFAKKLLSALKTQFSNSLDLWTSYCESVASSDFLMGKAGTFKAWLVWVIREETVSKIKQGFLGIKKIFRSAKETLTKSRTDLEKQILSLKESQILKTLRLTLLEKIGSGGYGSWFSAARFKEYKSQVLIKGKNRFVAEQISIKYGILLKDLCANVGKTIQITTE